MKPDLDSKTDGHFKTWEKAAPWYLTVISAGILLGIGWFLVSQILWLRDAMFDGDVSSNLEYRSHQYFLLISTVRRSAGLFAGIALMLLGVGVVFYSVRSQSKMDVAGHGFTFHLMDRSHRLLAGPLQRIFL